MRAVDIIARKRDGEELSAEEIDFFVQGLVSGAIPDYQVAAWAMAVLWRGMTAAETAALTWRWCARERMDLARLGPVVVDKTLPAAWATRRPSGGAPRPRPARR